MIGSVSVALDEVSSVQEESSVTQGENVDLPPSLQLRGRECRPFPGLLLERLLGGGLEGAEALSPVGQAEAQIDCSSTLVSPSEGLQAVAPC